MRRWWRDAALLKAVRWRLTAPAQRWTENRAALRRAFERGRKSGDLTAQALYHTRMLAEADRMTERFVRNGMAAGIYQRRTGESVDRRANVESRPQASA